MTTVLTEQLEETNCPEDRLIFVRGFPTMWNTNTIAQNVTMDGFVPNEIIPVVSKDGKPQGAAFIYVEEKYDIDDVIWKLRPHLTARCNSQDSKNEIIIIRHGVPKVSSPENVELNAKYIHDRFKLFVGHLAPSVTEAEIKPIFEKFGNVVNISILRSSPNGTSRGCGFVLYQSRLSAAAAIHFLNRSEPEEFITHSELVVRFCNSRGYENKSDHGNNNRGQHQPINRTRSQNNFSQPGHLANHHPHQLPQNTAHPAHMYVNDNYSDMSHSQGGTPNSIASHSPSGTPRTHTQYIQQHIHNQSGGKMPYGQISVSDPFLLGSANEQGRMQSVSSSDLHYYGQPPYSARTQSSSNNIRNAGRRGSHTGTYLKGAQMMNEDDSISMGNTNENASVSSVSSSNTPPPNAAVNGMGKDSRNGNFSHVRSESNISTSSYPSFMDAGDSTSTHGGSFVSQQHSARSNAPIPPEFFFNGLSPMSIQGLTVYLRACNPFMYPMQFLVSKLSFFGPLISCSFLNGDIFAASYLNVGDAEEAYSALSTAASNAMLQQQQQQQQQQQHGAIQEVHRHYAKYFAPAPYQGVPTTQYQQKRVGGVIPSSTTNQPSHLMENHVDNVSGTQDRMETESQADSSCSYDQSSSVAGMGHQDGPMSWGDHGTKNGGAFGQQNRQGNEGVDIPQIQPATSAPTVDPSQNGAIDFNTMERNYQKLVSLQIGHPTDDTKIQSPQQSATSM